MQASIIPEDSKTYLSEEGKSDSSYEMSEKKYKKAKTISKKEKKRKNSKNSIS